MIRICESSLTVQQKTRKTKTQFFHLKGQNVSAADLSGFNLQALLLSVPCEHFSAGMVPALLGHAVPPSAAAQAVLHDEDPADKVGADKPPGRPPFMLLPEPSFQLRGVSKCWSNRQPFPLCTQIRTCPSESLSSLLRFPDLLLHHHPDPPGTQQVRACAPV